MKDMRLGGEVVVLCLLKPPLGAAPDSVRKHVFLEC